MPRGLYYKWDEPAHEQQTESQTRKFNHRVPTGVQEPCENDVKYFGFLIFKCE